jgi:hypothetical protein
VNDEDELEVELEEELREDLIAAARQRDERAAQELGSYTPVEAMLSDADERANLWHDIINFLDRVARTSTDDELADKAAELLDRVHEI